MADFDLGPGKGDGEGFEAQCFSGTDTVDRVVVDVSKDPINNACGFETGLTTRVDVEGVFSTSLGDGAYSLTLGPEMINEEPHRQEDALCLHFGTSGLCLAVADGVGGVDSGEQASDSVIRNFYDQVNNGVGFHGAYTETISSYVKAGKTTFTALNIHEGILTTSNIGDSMVMVFRDGEICFRTEEHTSLNMIIKALEQKDYSRISESVRLYLSQDTFNSILNLQEDWGSTDRLSQVKKLQEYALENPRKLDFRLASGAYVTSVVKKSSRSDPDQETVPLQPGDKILIATDGLYPYAFVENDGRVILDFDRFITDQDLLQIVKNADSLDAIAKQLVGLARNRGSTDNLALIVFEYMPNQQSKNWRL